LSWGQGLWPAQELAPERRWFRVAGRCPARDSLVGGSEAHARAWVSSKNLSLAATPVDLLVTAEGLGDSSKKKWSTDW
jgi:hypothetical protein